MIPLEVCIEATTDSGVEASVEGASEGGASRIELCGNLSNGGCSPDQRFIQSARSKFPAPGQLLVMVRPNPGTFACTDSDVATMVDEIEEAAQLGADGVVFGALRDARIDETSTLELIQVAKDCGLAITFHRAFDAVANRFAALQWLIDHGVDRILTSGTTWNDETSTVPDTKALFEFIRFANNTVEIVAGGGITMDNVSVVSATLAGAGSNFSIHCHSALLHGANIDKARTTRMKELISTASPTIP